MINMRFIIGELSIKPVAIADYLDNDFCQCRGLVRPCLERAQYPPAIYPLRLRIAAAQSTPSVGCLLSYVHLRLPGFARIGSMGS